MIYMPEYINLIISSILLYRVVFKYSQISQTIYNNFSIIYVYSMKKFFII